MTTTSHSKPRLALTLVLLALAGTAHAQSSVTIYGRVNATVENQRAGDGERETLLVNNASRLGFKGREDLGGGAYAAFKLESGIDVTSGVSNGFQRESMVELGGHWGAVRLGNWGAGSYLSTADFVSMHNHDTGTSSDALYAFETYSAPKKLGYFTPNWGGLSGEISTTLAGDGQPRTTDLSANWASGPWMLGAGYSKRDNASQWAVRALHSAGALTVGGYLQRETIKGSPYGDSRTIGRLAAMYGIGQGEVHANVGWSGRGASMSDKATQYTLGYNYNLSKRTKAYVFYTAIDSRDNSQDFNSFALGVRHNF